MNKKTSGKWLGFAVIVVIVIAVILIASLGTPSSSTNPTASTDASLTLIGPGSDTVEVGDLQHVRWSSENYGPSTVSVNVIRKVSDNPAQYELVRTVSGATANDGDAVWVPAKSDVGGNVFVEVACAVSLQGCHASRPVIALAVIDSNRFSNTAAIYDAIERMSN